MSDDYEIITDRSAWKTDDPEWVKARKRQWRDIRRSLEYDTPFLGEPFYFLRKKNHKRIKEYFLTGTVTTNFPEVRLDPKPNHPLGGIEAVLLFYIWLHPDDSENNWTRLRERLSGLWPKAQTRFFESISKYPADFPLFGDFDFEKRLYDFFCARQGPYALDAERLCGQLASWIGAYFQREQEVVRDFYRTVPGSRHFISNPNHIVRHGLEDYVECCWELLNDEAYVESLRLERNDSWVEDNALEIFFKFFVRNIANCHIALEIAEDNDPAYADVAKTLLDLMQAKEWPSVASHVFDEGLARAKEELKAGS